MEEEEILMRKKAGRHASDYNYEKVRDRLVWKEQHEPEVPEHLLAKDHVPYDQQAKYLRDLEEARKKIAIKKPAKKAVKAVKKTAQKPKKKTVKVQSKPGRSPQRGRTGR